MKRTILAISACIMAMSCSSLRILTDSTDKNGRRTVCTSMEGLFMSGAGEVSLAMGARVDKKDTVLALLAIINTDVEHGVFDQGDRMRIRMADGSEIELTNVLDKEFEQKTEVGTDYQTVNVPGYNYAYDPYYGGPFVIYPYTVTTMVPRTYVRKDNYSTALYPLTKKQLKTIMTGTIAKLRIEIENDELDMRGPESTSAVVTELYNCLHQRVKAPKSASRKKF